MVENQYVAAGIALETRIVGRIRGVQIQGVVKRVEEDEGGSGDAAEFTTARSAYFKRFPYAAAMPDLTLWLLEPTLMKLTDNTLGFGKKLVWAKED